MAKKVRQRSHRGRGGIYEKRSKTKGTRWVIVASYHDWNGRRRRPQLTFGTREQAISAQQFLQDTRLSKGKISGSAMTITQLTGQWLDQMPVQNGTVIRREISLRCHIVPYLGHKRVIEMDSATIDRWKNLLRDAGHGPAARQVAWTTLRCMISYAIDTLKLMTVHPMFGLKGPKREAKEIVPFSDEEMLAIFKASAGHRLRPFLQVLYSLGLRQGEALGLKWEDLDLEKRHLQIRRQVLEEGGKLVIKERTKTKSGLRTLELTDAHLVIFETRRLLAEDEGLSECEWIFPNLRGGPIRRSNILFKYWRPLLATLGIPHRGLHHFRHTAATQMLLDKNSLLDVAGSLGHSKPETTLRLYSHIIKKVHGAPLGGLASRFSSPVEEVEEKVG